MNVDKLARCGEFLLINGPGVVIVLYWASDGSCYCIIVHVRFWIELLIQMRLCLIFVKLCIPMNGTHVRVSGYTISIGFRGLMGDQRTPRFWGVTAWYQSIGV